MNASASWPEAEQARNRVLEIQTKLHRWAVEDRSKCFDDLFNLVCDPGVFECSLASGAQQ